MQVDDLLTPAEVATTLGVAPHTLAIWRCTRRHLAFIKVGRLVRYRADEIQRFVEVHTNAVDSEPNLLAPK